MKRFKIGYGHDIREEFQYVVDDAICVNPLYARNLVETFPWILRRFEILL